MHLFICRCPLESPPNLTNAHIIFKRHYFRTKKIQLPSKQNNTLCSPELERRAAILVKCDFKLRWSHAI
jgi:hypothetical protein